MPIASKRSEDAVYGFIWIMLAQREGEMVVASEKGLFV